MQPGNLVRIKRGGIAIPAGTLGLLMSYSWMVYDTGTKIWSVSILSPTRSGRERQPARYLEGDLELVS